MDSLNRFSLTTVILHWAVALVIIGLLCSGVYMVETETYSLYPWHKAIGFLVFFLALTRVLWRIKNGWPRPLGEDNQLLQSVAHLIHWVLILGTVLMPLSGFMMSVMGGSSVDVFGWEVVAANPDPNNPGQRMPRDADWAGFFHSVHHWGGYCLVAALFLHVGGALKHHVLDKDGTLKRMLGRRV